MNNFEINVIYKAKETRIIITFRTDVIFLFIVFMATLNCFKFCLLFYLSFHVVYYNMMMCINIFHHIFDKF